jgi:Transposase DDE domain
VITSKSPRRVLQVAYDAACEALPAHRHRFSPKKFTQHQLLACLVLKEFLRLDYRGLAAHLADHPDLCRLISLGVVPHYTTFQKAAVRLLAAVPGRKMFDAVLERALKDRVRKRRVRLAAVDGTGMESRQVSRYYVKRRSGGGDADPVRTYSHFPKVVFVVDCQSHMILAAVAGRGPGSDLVQFGRALSQAVRRARIGALLADADFDAEWVHEAVRSHGIRTIIPATRGRPSDKPPAGRWRRRMKRRFGQYKRKYGQRWQVETVNSMIKRRLGSALRARVEANQSREIILRAITHNVMIVRIRVFYRAGQEPLFKVPDPLSVFSRISSPWSAKCSVSPR